MGKILWSTLVLAAALPALAQQPEKLVGAWETTQIDSTGKFTVRIDLASDGKLGMTAQGEVSTAELQGEGGPNLFPNGLTISFTGSGTWRGDQDSLWVELQQVDYQINGQSFDEFFSALIEQMVQALAQGGQIPQDQLPQFEQLLRDELTTQFSKEEFEKQMMGELTGTQAMGYSVSGDVLATVSEDGEITEFKKASVNSAVSAVSWGQVKAGWR